MTSEAFEEINTRSIISPVTAQAGTITTGIIYIRTVEYVLEWSAPVRIFRLKDPENPEEGTLTGTLDGEQAVDAQLVIEVQDFRDDDGDSSTTSVPVPTSAPDNSGGGGGGGGPNCFSAKSTVEVTGKGILPISKLTIGDFVHVGNGDFSQVYSFGHYDTQSKTDFLQIHAEGLLEPIEITSAHMLYVNDVALRADQVQIGDMLGKHKVWNITTMTRAGRFAPLTNSGDIVISGVRASCYVAFLDGLPPRFMNTITHVVLGARRLKCYANFNLCENEQYTDEEGIADWLSPSLSFLTDLEGYQGIIQAGVGLLALPVINLSFIVEPKMVSISSVGTMIGSLFAFSWA